MVVDRVFVKLSVVEDVVPLEIGVLSGEPLANFLVKEVFLRELVGHVGLARDLVRRRLFLALVVSVLVVRIRRSSSKAPHAGLGQCAATLSRWKIEAS